MKKLGFDLIILGAPTSGKDTQARLLSHYYALKKFESGVYLRKAMNRQDSLGKKIRATVGKAKPAPTSVIKSFLTEALKNPPKVKNLVFVGNPKLKPEAQFLVKLLKKNNRDFLALYIKLPEQEILKRSYYRKRHDDLDLRLIKRRISWHKKQMGKTVKYFQKLNKLKFIDGNKSIFAVARDVSKAINDYKKSQGN